MTGRKSSVCGLKHKTAIISWLMLAIVTGISAYTMPINNIKYPVSGSVLQAGMSNLAKRSASVINRYILQSFRQRDPEQELLDPVIGARGRFMETPLNVNSGELKFLPDNIISATPLPYVSMERRGPKLDRRTYVRCYFNAVSCF